MYGWLWRTLPGGVPGKLFGSLLLLVGALALLFFIVFPRVETLLPFQDVTVDTIRNFCNGVGDLNPLYRDMLGHYGVVGLPCRVGDPDRKGKVESGVGHTQKTPLYGLRFDTLEQAQAIVVMLSPDDEVKLKNQSFPRNGRSPLMRFWL